MIKHPAELSDYLNHFHPNQPEFHQAINEWFRDISDLYFAHKSFQEDNILTRLIEADRVIQFKVDWRDDEGQARTQLGWRVQHSQALGPYKGGLRFHQNVNASILKFLAFEQTFKNALTGLPLGSGKGGAAISTKHLSRFEIERFCKAYMTELGKYLGEMIDVPAGDIGVSNKEIGYMFGQYLKIKGENECSLTGKNPLIGGSLGREEATGFGCIYFLDHILDCHHLEQKNLTISISGSGNVALFAAQKALEKAHKVVTLSDSEGTLWIKNGLNQVMLETIKQHKFIDRGRLSALSIEGTEFFKGKNPWESACDIAIPCATQNELNDKDAKKLIKNGVKVVVEGANMPVTLEAHEALAESGVIMGPAKAANAGGVAVSNFEIAQNAQHLPWKFEDVDRKLQDTMNDIHCNCIKYIEKEKGIYNYAKGANTYGFMRVAEAIHNLGC